MAHAQIEVLTEAQVTASGGEHTPLWLNANKQGLSSLDKTNGYVRVGAFRSYQQETDRRWKRGFGADVAVAKGFTSDMVVQQLYGEVGWGSGLLTLGAKNQHLELKNEELSTGSQTLGINARPVPGVRLGTPDYWSVPGTHGWLGLKGHIFYGWTSDDGWQKDFTKRNSLHTEHTMLHTKAGYVRMGKPDSHFTVELGLEMGCQFGGSTYYSSSNLPDLENNSGIMGMLRAFIPGGGETNDVEYKNEMGNHVGSWVSRFNLDYDAWGVSLYADHFFEDHSQMFFLDYDGYGSGEDWDSWERFNWMVYDLKDIQLGAELRLKKCRWVENIVAEYIYTKYQSGPVYHDHTRTMSDHVSGMDNYYNHYIYTGWQHWGQVMGNPLYRSPLYNANGKIEVQDNRFYAWHLGVSGTPLDGLHYRLLATWQKGYGTYSNPYLDPQSTFCILAEARYEFAERSKLAGWSVKGAFALDRGELLGDNTGMQITVCKKFDINTKH